MPSRYDITSEQGSTYKIHFYYKNGTTGVDLSGYTASLQVRPSKFSEKIYLSAINENLYTGNNDSGFTPSLGQTGSIQIGGIFLNVNEDNYPGTTGGILFIIGPEATKNIKSGKNFYDLELNSPTETFRLLEGSFDSIPEITKVTSQISGIVGFSENLQNLIEYEATQKILTISGLTFTAGSFIKTPKFEVDLLDIQAVSGKNIDFSFNSNLQEIKISDEGKDLLIYSKVNNKIYHIGMTGSFPGTCELKYTITESIAGNPGDKLWSVDNELSSMVLSTKALERSFTIYDTKLTSHTASSKIKYYRRSMNGKNKYKWKKIHESPAAGIVASYKREASSNYQFTDSINYASGIYRTNDIKTRDKFFSLSTISLINDQKNYNSKITGFYSPRYVTNQLNRDIGITYFAYSSYDSGGLTQAGFTVFNNIFGISQADDAASARKYKCSPSLKLFKIHTKSNDYFQTDNTYRDAQGLNYYYPLDNVNQTYSNINYLIQGITIPNSISDLMKLFPSKNLLTIGEPTEAPEFEQELKYSQTSFADNFVCYSLLYDFISSAQSIKRLVVLKFPKSAANNLNVFKDYTLSSVSSSLVPNSGISYGIITSYYGITGTEQVGKFKTLSPFSYEVFTTTSDKLVQNENLNQINEFKFHTSNNRYFILFNSRVLIWSYASETYTIIDQPDSNFSQASFYFNQDGEFFIVGNNIWKYDNSTISFTKIQVI